MKKNKITVVIALGLLLIGTHTLPAKAKGKFHLKHYGKLKVATWNVYIGTDLFAILNGDLPLQDAISEIVASNFPARAKEIVKKLVSNSSDLIGFQEAWRIEINLPELQFERDYKDDLADILGGLGYVEVAFNELTDITIPFGGEYYIRIVDRDVIFAKNDVNILEIYGKDYNDILRATLLFDTIPIEIESKRGYLEVHVESHGREYVFVNTHLEDMGLPALSPGGIIYGVAQELQAKELAEHLSDETRPIILVGDFNALPDDEVTMIMEEAGFADMWTRSIFERRDPGFTCCQDRKLLNFRSTLDERIDYIYVRNNKGGELPFTLALSLSARVIGDNIGDKTKTKPRLWPSDHGGVRATLLIPSLGNLY